MYLAPTFDCLVIGGGPAGLQAALTLGRMHREVMLVDSGEYRNAAVDHAHNFITLDGVPPAEIRDRALRDLAAYDTVRVRPGRVDSVVRVGDDFEAHLGADSIRARTVILATGVRDCLADVPGLAEVWGKEAANCPFCHGHEFAGQQVALVDMGDHAVAIAAMLAPIVAGSIEVDPADIGRIDRVGGGVRLVMTEGEPLEVAGLFVRADFVQSAPFAAQLDLAMLPTGCIEVDLFGHTSMPGVYAAGDLAGRAEMPMPMASIMVAASAGQVAAATCTRELAMATL